MKNSIVSEKLNKELAIEALKRLAGDRHWELMIENRFSSWKGESLLISAYVESIGHTDYYSTYKKAIKAMKKLINK